MARGWRNTEGGIVVVSADDRPYGPGQSDYEYDTERQRQVDDEQQRRDDEKSNQGEQHQ